MAQPKRIRSRSGFLTRLRPTAVGISYLEQKVPPSSGLMRTVGRCPASVITLRSSACNSLSVGHASMSSPSTTTASMGRPAAMINDKLTMQFPIDVFMSPERRVPLSRYLSPCRVLQVLWSWSCSMLAIPGGKQ